MTSSAPSQPNGPKTCWIYRWWRKFCNSRWTQFNICDVLSTVGVICAVVALYYTMLSVEAANKTFAADQAESTLDALREYNYQFINGGFGFYEHIILDPEITKTVSNVMTDDPVIMTRYEQRRAFLLICKMDSENIKYEDVFAPHKSEGGYDHAKLTALGKSILREKIAGYLNMRELMLSAPNTDAVDKELYLAKLGTFNIARPFIAKLLKAMDWVKMYPNTSKWCGIY